MDRPNQPYARGQVAVMLFEVPPAAFLPLGDAMTVLINKPQFVMQYLQFPGGMLKPGETFADAARREPQEETGVIASSDPNDLIELCRVPKRRFGPDTGSFDWLSLVRLGAILVADSIPSWARLVPMMKNRN